MTQAKRCEEPQDVTRMEIVSKLSRHAAKVTTVNYVQHCPTSHTFLARCRRARKASVTQHPARPASLLYRKMNIQANPAVVEIPTSSISRAGGVHGPLWQPSRVKGNPQASHDTDFVEFGYSDGNDGTESAEKCRLFPMCLTENLHVFGLRPQQDEDAHHDQHPRSRL